MEYCARKKHDPEVWKRYLSVDLVHNPTLQLWPWFQNDVNILADMPYNKSEW